MALLDDVKMDTWTNFLFLRHGQTDWNLEGRFQGVADIPLNATGIDQAAGAATILARQPIDRIVSSPLIRALKTAAIVSERISIPIDIDTQLIERGFGKLEGLVVNDVKRDIGISLDVPMARHLPPDAEQWPDTVARTQAAIDTWLARCPGETLLFVAHHGLFAALSELLTGHRKEGENGVPYEFQRSGAVWTITKVK
ncbi:MAG: broad specificity phosphatase PhoE [Hyphomicrobiaceae bacterium]